MQDTLERADVLDGYTDANLIQAFLSSYHGSRNKKLPEADRTRWAGELTALGPQVMMRAGFHPDIETRGIYADLMHRMDADRAFSDKLEQAAAASLARMNSPELFRARDRQSRIEHDMAALGYLNPTDPTDPATARPSRLRQAQDPSEGTSPHVYKLNPEDQFIQAQEDEGMLAAEGLELSPFSTFPSPELPTRSLTRDVTNAGQGRGLSDETVGMLGTELTLPSGASAAELDEWARNRKQGGGHTPEYEAISEITHDREDATRLFVPEHFANRQANEFQVEIEHRQEVFSAPKDDDGFIEVTGRGRIKVPDYSHLSDEIRDAVMGYDPEMPDGLAAMTAGAPVFTGLSNLMTRGQAAVSRGLEAVLPEGAGEGLDYNQMVDVDTALPMGKLQYAIPLVRRPDGSTDYRKSFALLQDPMHARGVMDEIDKLVAEDKLKASAAEMFWGTTGFLMDFTATNSALMGLGGMAGRGISAAGGRLATALGPGGKVSHAGIDWFVKNRIAKAYGARGLAQSARYVPLLSGTIRTPLEFARYEATAAFVNGDSALHGAWEGTQSGLTMMGMGFAARLGRRQAGSAYLAANRVMGSVLKREWFLPGAQSLDYFRRAADRVGDSQLIIERFKQQLPSMRGDVTSQIAKLYGQGETASWVAKAVDAEFIGLSFSAWGEAHRLAGEDWDTLSGVAKATLFIDQLTNPGVHAAAIPFVLSTGLHREAHKAGITEDLKAKKEQAVALQELIIGQLAHETVHDPAGRGLAHASEMVRLFDVLWRDRPDAFKDFEDPAAHRQALSARMRNIQLQELLAKEEIAPSSRDEPPPEAPPAPEGPTAPEGSGPDVPRGTPPVGRKAPKQERFFDVTGDPLLEADGTLAPPRNLPEGQLKNLQLWHTPGPIQRLQAKERRALGLEVWQQTVEELAGADATEGALVYAARIIRGAAEPQGHLQRSFERGELRADRVADIIESAGMELPPWLWAHVDAARLRTRPQTPLEEEATVQAHQADPDKVGKSDVEVLDQVQRERVEKATKGKTVTQIEEGMVTPGAAEAALGEMRTLKGDRFRPWLLRKSKERLRTMADALGAEVTGDWSKAELADAIEGHGLGEALPVRIDQARAISKRIRDLKAEVRRKTRKKDMAGAAAAGEQLKAAYEDARAQFGDLATLEDAARRGAKARSKGFESRAAAAMAGEFGIVPFLQAQGGLEHSNDIPKNAPGEMTGPGFSSLMQAKGKGGISLERAVELAREAGFLHEAEGEEIKGGINELLELIDSNRRVEVGRETESAEDERERHEMDAQLDQAQTFLDRGGDARELPDWIRSELGVSTEGPRPTAPEGEVEAVAHERLMEPPLVPFAKEGLEGLSEGVATDAIVTWVRETGLPPEVRMAQAGTWFRQAALALKANGIIPQDVEMTSPAAGDVVRRVLTGDAELRRMFSEKNAGSGMTEQEIGTAWDSIVRGLNTYNGYALAAHVETHKTRPELVHAWIRSMEDIARHGKLTPEVRRTAEKEGIIDEFGQLDLRALSVFDDAMRIQLERGGEEFDALNSGFASIHALMPAMRTFARRAGKLIGVSSLWDNSKSMFPAMETPFMRNFVDRHAVGEATWVSDLNQYITLHLGRMDHAGGLPSLVAKNVRDMQERVVDKRQKQAMDLQIAAAMLGQKMIGEWGTYGPPKEVKGNLVRLMNDGAFKNGRITSPEQLEKELGPGTAHLYEYAHDFAALFSEVAQELVGAGYLNQAQALAFDGRYVPHINLEVTKKDIDQSIKDGNPSWFFAGRDLRRAQSSELQVLDPDFLVHIGMSQSIRAIEFMGSVKDIISQGLSWTPRELAEMNNGQGLSAREKRWLQTVAVPRTETHDPLTGRKVKPMQHYMHDMIEGWRNSMQSKHDAERGIYAKEGEHPYSDVKQKMIDELVPKDGQVGRSMQIQNARMLEDLREGTFFQGYHEGALEASRTNNFARWLGGRYDEVSRYWRRNMTVLKAQHWWLNEISSVMLNYTSGGVSPLDYARSALTGKGHYADGWRSLMNWEKFVKAGSPKVETEAGRAKLEEIGLLEAVESGELKRTTAFAERLMGSTFHHTLIESGVIGDVMAPLLDNAAIERALQNDGEAHGLKQELFWKEDGALDQSSMKMLNIALSVQGRVLGPSQSRFDRKLIEGMGSDNVGEQVRALANHSAWYQMNELGFKYANTLAFWRSRPGYTWDQAMETGARGTVNFNKISSTVRNMSTRFNIAADEASLQAGEGFAGKTHVAAKMGAKFLLQGPFWMFRFGNIPHQLRAGLRNPLRAAAVAAGGGAVMTVLGDQMFDDGGGNQFDEAMPGTSYGQSLPGPDEALWSAYEKLVGFKAPTSVPGFMGGADIDANTRYSLSRWAHKFKQNYSMIGRGPSRGGIERMMDVSDYAWPLGPVEKMARSMRDHGNVSNKERGRSHVEALYGLAPSMMKGFATHVGDIWSPGRQTRASRVAVAARTFAMQFAPDVYPGLSFMGPQSQRLFTQTESHGVPIDKWMQGMVTKYDAAVSPEHRILDFAISGVVPTRQVPSWLDDNATDDTLIRSVISNVLPEWNVEKGSDDEKHKIQSVRLVRDYLNHWVGSAYLHFKRTPGTNFDDLLINGLDISKDIQRAQDGSYHLVEKPTTDIGKFIANHPERSQQLSEVAVKYLTRQGGAWVNRVQPALMAAARSRGMDVAVFRRIYQSSLTDPHGAATINVAYRDLITGGNHDKAADYWYVLRMLSPPPDSSNNTTRERWQKLMGYFNERVQNADLHLGGDRSVQQSLGALQFGGGHDTNMRRLQERPPRLEARPTEMQELPDQQ